MFIPFHKYSDHLQCAVFIGHIVSFQSTRYDKATFLPQNIEVFQVKLYMDKIKEYTYAICFIMKGSYNVLSGQNMFLYLVYNGILRKCMNMKTVLRCTPHF